MHHVHTSAKLLLAKNSSSEKVSAMHQSGQQYRESLRRYHPRVFINGRQVDVVADEPLLAPGIAGVALTYDFALREDLAPWMRARPQTAARLIA